VTRAAGATPALEAVDVTRSYALEGGTVQALRGVSLTVEQGDYAAVVGPSGSGKSTLMHLLGGLDRPTTGVLRVGGRDIATLSEDELAQVRNATIGFVFQAFQLLGRTSAVDNVAMPLVYRGAKRAERRKRAVLALERVGMGHRLDHRPAQLSGGEQQRVAIARALVGDPQVLLADEPTGNLDTRTGEEVMALLEALNTEQGVAVVLVTHDLDVAARARRRSGCATGCSRREAHRDEADRMRLAEAWRVAVTALRANRLRSLLTMLGVVIGVAAVVVLVAIGTGASARSRPRSTAWAPTSSSSCRGGSSSARRPPAAGCSSTTPSAWAGRSASPGASPRPWPAARPSAPAAAAPSPPSTGRTGRARGLRRPIARGSYLRDSDVDTRRRVAVVGSSLARTLFDGADRWAGRCPWPGSGSA
jgi:putative ABC transport system ATP-binding protein